MTEKQIIKKAVEEACESIDEEFRTRENVARESALLADKKGVNVQTASYLQDIFYATLDEYFGQ